MWNIDIFHSLYGSESWPRREIALELIQYLRVPACHDFDRPVRQIPCEPG